MNFVFILTSNPRRVKAARQLKEYRLIHDAHVEVTCDGRRCTESVLVELHFVYLNNNPDNGVYDHRDKVVEKDLKREHEWIVRDDKHFCSEECAESDNTQPAPV